MRIVIRSNIYECNYSYNDNKDFKSINKLLKNDCRKFGLVRVLLFNTLKESHEWSRNAIENPNILNIDDLL